MSAAAPDEVRPFPWRELMALFIGERRMAPADFWALTLPEIQAVLGPPAPGGTRRGDLARLMERFPDA
ncbi:phage tail assembly chaperone [Acuticoccus sediminis]|nr:phage tail assembly chaperone [Acuticoccus sediminis]